MGEAAARAMELLWLTLPESRPGRELAWLAGMPDADVRAVAETPTGDPVPTTVRPFRRVTRRFVEAGALAWYRDLDTVAESLDGRGGQFVGDQDDRTSC